MSEASDPLKRPRLGKTEGMMALGAWAARLEVAHMLTSGVSAGELIRLINSGQEGPEPLRMNQPVQPHVGRRVLHSDLGERAPSSSKEGSAEKKVEESPSAKVAQEILKLDFKKRAVKPPSISVEDYTPSIAPTSPGGGEIGGAEIESPIKLEELKPVLESFKKKAAPPAVQPKETQAPKTPALQRAHPKRRHQKEEDLYKCQSVFEYLVVAEVEMDLVKLVASPEGIIQQSEFRSLTEPRNPSTGVRYANLMLNYCEFFGTKYGRQCVEPHILSGEFLLEYIQHLIDSGAGFRSPQGLLYALEYFKVSFGFESKGTKNLRCKKMADNYASTAPPRTPAPHLDIDLLDYLESSVLDEKKATAFRLVSGLLRLCVQSPTRHNDVPEHPIGWDRVGPHKRV